MAAVSEPEVGDQHIARGIEFTVMRNAGGDVYLRRQSLSSGAVDGIRVDREVYDAEFGKAVCDD